MEKILSYLIILLQLSSCSTIISAGAIAGNASTSTRGFSGTIEDTYLMSKITAKISAMNLSNLTNINVSVNRGEVLLTGNIQSQEDRLDLIKKVWEVKEIRKIYNEVKVGESLSIIDKTEDIIFETKIENRLLFEDGIYSNNYDVEVVDGNVYVMGIASSIEEKNKLENYLKTMNDIKRLILFISIAKNEKKN